MQNIPPISADELPDNLALGTVQAAIGAAALLASRRADDICLIAVSKTRTAAEIEPLLGSGHRHFGENRVQEAAAKWPELRRRYRGVQLHLIGQLQSNKAADAVALFDFIHSADRTSLITALGVSMAAQNKFVPCFIQVNIGDEPQKGGCDIGDLPQIIAAARDAAVPLAGLMCLPPAGKEPAPYFALLAKLAARHALPHLSMGMSDDFSTAIMLGATHIRVGTALFGAR
jgi:PLP dependent protein